MGLSIGALALVGTLAGGSSVAGFDDLWLRRDDPAAAAELARSASDFAGSNDYQQLWRAASWYVWLASGETNKDAVRRDALAARQAGERALKLQPSGIEARYWTALGVGLYASAVEPVKALSLDLEANYRKPLQEVIQEDPREENPRVERVGAELALGEFYHHLPWPNPHHGEARKLIEGALRAHPENLRAHYLLGEMLVAREPDRARTELGAVLVGDGGYDPPDARRYKRKARALLAQLP